MPDQIPPACALPAGRRDDSRTLYQAVIFMLMNKNAIEKYSGLFLYVSLVFLAIYLVRYDYVALNFRGLNYGYLGLSLLFLFLGFLLHATCWYRICRQSIEDVSLSVAITSHGLSIFGKYIPGKLWTVIGRAAYLSRIGVALTATAQLSFYTVILSVWSGLALGIAGLALVDRPNAYLPGMILLWALLGVFLFTPLHSLAWVRNLMKRFNVSLPRFQAADHFRTIPLFFLFWLSWSVGFSFLLEALLPGTIFPFSAGLAFPFATTIGILAFVFPGGLGVREGCLVLYLVKSGLLTGDAALVSITARMWFVLGEIFIFVIALLLKTSAFKEQAP